MRGQDASKSACTPASVVVIFHRRKTTKRAIRKSPGPPEPGRALQARLQFVEVLERHLLPVPVRIRVCVCVNLPRKKWRRTFTFSDYISGFAEDLGELMDSPHGELYYWLDKVSESEVQIFASLDDPLNEEVDWPDNKNIFLVDYGGHYGLRGFNFFDDFLFSIF